MSHDIHPYLRAIEEIDWTKVQTQRNEEHYADWFYIDGQVLFYGGSKEDAVIEFLKRAPAAIRQLLADLDHATTTREAIMPSNLVYGSPPEPERGEPARFLADAIEVQRPNGDVVRMDLVALADAAINADRAVASLREENLKLQRRVAELQIAMGQVRAAGRMLAGRERADQ